MTKPTSPSKVKELCTASFFSDVAHVSMKKHKQLMAGMKSYTHGV